MALRAFFDTCVLFSPVLTDTLLGIAEEDAFRPQWSAGVLSELHTVLEREAGLPYEKAERRIAQMQADFRPPRSSTTSH